MIPLRDDNPTRRFPFVTVGLIVLNIAVFLFEWSMDPADLQTLWQRWAFIPSGFLADPAAPDQAITAITSMFLHAGWVHLAGNMLYLWIFGNNIEDRLGRFRFLLFYLACGVAALAAQTVAGPEVSIPTLGASGAVAGVLGAYILLYPRTSITTVIPLFVFFEVARLPAYIVIGFWFLLQLANGLATLDPVSMQAGGVAWFAHLGGFVAGLAVAVPMALAARRRKMWR